MSCLKRSQRRMHLRISPLRPRRSRRFFRNGFQPVAASSPPTSAQQLDPLALLKAMKDLQPDPPDPPDPLAVMERAQKLFVPQAAANDDFSRFEKFLSVADSWRDGEVVPV